MNSIFEPFRQGRLVGFDDLFSTLDRAMETATNKVTWPPYNIAKLAEHAYQLQFALAGFSKDEIKVYRDGEHLVVEGHLADRDDQPNFLYQGISYRDFLVKFLLADGADVQDVTLDNGILSVEVKKNVEEPKRIDFKIKTPAGPAALGTSESKPRTTTDVMEEMIEASSD